MAKKQTDKPSLEVGLNQIALARKLDGVKISTDVVKSESFQEQYQGLTTLIDYLSQVKKAVDAGIKSVVMAEYEATGEGTISSDLYNYTYVAPSTRENFDTAKFKEEHPDLYIKYVKVGSVSDSIRVTKVKKKSAENKESSIEASFAEIK